MLPHIVCLWPIWGIGRAEGGSFCWSYFMRDGDQRQQNGCRLLIRCRVWVVLCGREELLVSSESLGLLFSYAISGEPRANGHEWHCFHSSEKIGEQRFHLRWVLWRVRNEAFIRFERRGGHSIDLWEAMSKSSSKALLTRLSQRIVLRVCFWRVEVETS